MSGLYAWIHRKIVHPLWTWKDGAYPYGYLAEFERTQHLSPEALADYQWAKLKKLLDHAYANCPYYGDSWQRAGVGPGDIRSMADFSRLPMLGKRDIQENLKGLTRQDVPQSELVRNMTGGSTGEPLVFYMDKERVKSRAASTIRHDRWAGKDVDTMFASVWGHFRDTSMPDTAWQKWKNRWIYRCVTLDTSSIDEAKIRFFVEQARVLKPEVYVAYANSIHYLAQYLKANGVDDFPRPRSIISTAEMLEDSRKTLVEEVFRCPVYNRYGCREASVIASECERRDGMHVNAEAILLEVVREGRPVEPGQTGEIVITDLLNYATPLIRYRIKDAGTLRTGRCACGRGLPRLDIVGGRVTDFLKTPEGKVVSGASLTIFLTAHAPGVRQMQLCQDRIEALQVRVVRGQGYGPESEDFIRMTAAKFVGSGVLLSFEYVDEIAPTASGKHRYCISSLNPFE